MKFARIVFCVLLAATLVLLSVTCYQSKLEKCPVGDLEVTIADNHFSGEYHSYKVAIKNINPSRNIYVIHPSAEIGAVKLFVKNGQGENDFGITDSTWTERGFTGSILGPLQELLLVFDVTDLGEGRLRLEKGQQTVTVREGDDLGLRTR